MGGAVITVKFADNDKPQEEGKGKGKMNVREIPADNRALNLEFSKVLYKS